MGSQVIPPSGSPIPVAPALEPALRSAAFAPPPLPVDRRVVVVSLWALGVAAAAALVAQLLTRLIGLVTNLAFYGRLSTTFVSPAGNRLGAWVVLVPVAGGIVVGVLARWGSAAIRGHGIPEAMEQVLLNESRIPPRVTFLKPLSAAVAIGTGGPFGAEGPIIATGGALGSLVGQLLHTTALERKTLLAAGAAAGMAATFGSPVSAVLLALELLLFEFRPRSFIPVALAAAAAAGIRAAIAGTAPVFAMPEVAFSSLPALGVYAALGLLAGGAAVLVTRAVYGMEDLFDRLPIHWMWWPAIGALAVGVVGFVAPRTLGVGYDNIEGIVAGRILGGALVLLFVLKFVSWVVALGSGTSGGTLAPLLTIGGGLGAVTGEALAYWFPGLGVDVRVAAVVGMAALFAGASRAVLASVVFAFETTQRPAVLLPLLAGCAAAYLVSCLSMRNTIMTEKIARRGVRVPSEYAADVLEQVAVGEVCSRRVVVLPADETLGEVRSRISRNDPAVSHQGFPVVDGSGRLLGVVTRRSLLDAAHGDGAVVASLVARPASVVFEESSLRDAADLMVEEDIGRLPVVSREAPDRVTGFLTRSDLLVAHRRRLRERDVPERTLDLLPRPGPR